MSTCMSRVRDNDSGGESASEVLSIMADSESESFEGFESEDIRKAEKKLADKMKEIKNARQTTGTVVSNVSKDGDKQIPAKPAKKRKASEKKSKSKKKKSNDVTNALLNMNSDEVDKFREMLGLNDIVGCIYNLQQEHLNSLPQSVDNELVSSDLTERNESHNDETECNFFNDFFDNESTSNYEADEKESEEWEIPEWFSSDKKGKDVDPKLAEMVNTLCTKEGETSKIIENNPRPGNCTYLAAPRVNSDIWNILPKSAQTRDSGFQAIQKTIATGITPLLRIAELSKRNENCKEIRELIKQSVIVLCNSVFQMSQKRRFLMRKVLPHKFSDICNASQPVSEFLFGSDIQKKIKELSEFDKYKRDRFRNTSNSYRERARGRRPFYSSRGRSSFLGARNKYSPSSYNRTEKRGGQGFRQ